MSPFEYLLLLASVILGLAVSDLATSTHRLLDAGRRVRWDALAPLAAVIAFERIVTQWWAWYGTDHYAKGLTFGMFLALLVSAVLLFLTAAAALPDQTDAEVVDLRTHYARVARRFWLLTALQWTLANAVSIWAQMQIDGARLDLASPAFLLLPAMLLLAALPWRWLHGVGLIGFAIFYAAVSFGHALG